MEILRGQQVCACGKRHNGILDAYIVEKGAVSRTAEFVKKYGKERAFLLADANTFAVAGAQVVQNLTENGIAYSQFVFPAGIKPDETAVGSAIMHYDASCDIIIGIGSGVINDIGKIVAKTSGNPYIIVATAPSMDGYASGSSSMEVDGLKTSLNTKCPDVVIGDIDILKNAPARMLVSGIGDMLAKYVSICEWRIGHLVTGEYYCEEVASLIRTAVQKCTQNAAGLLKRDENAVTAVFEGLILGGVAMNYAEVTRPASGMEHYFSHIWDMRALEFGTISDFHGIQCAIGTLYTTKGYEQLKHIVPNRERALAYARSFDRPAHQEKLRAFLGKGAESMIQHEEEEGKYDQAKHAQRLENILAHWDEILQIVDEELLSVTELETVLDTLGAPKTAAEIGIDESLVPTFFRMTKDIRDKYVLSLLCWDLGVLDEIQL